jgi:acyl-CoA synthetase (NDP forming)
MNINIKEILDKKGPLAENEVKDILKSYSISTTNYSVVSKIQDLDFLKMKYPVALKLCSDKILHKTDVGGVILNIKNIKELKEKLRVFIEKFPNEKFLVDQMEEKSVEIIIGLVRDPTFGLSIMVGVGGIYTELYEDVSFRVVPIDNYDAFEMVEEIKGKKLLEGFRNIKANKKLVIDLLLKVSKIGEELIDHIDQMDLNPVFIYEDRICVVDAKLILK